MLSWNSTACSWLRKGSYWVQLQDIITDRIDFIGRRPRKNCTFSDIPSGRLYHVLSLLTNFDRSKTFPCLSRVHNRVAVRLETCDSVFWKKSAKLFQNSGSKKPVEYLLPPQTFLGLRGLHAIRAWAQCSATRRRWIHPLRCSLALRSLSNAY